MNRGDETSLEVKEKGFQLRLCDSVPNWWFVTAINFDTEIKVLF